MNGAVSNQIITQLYDCYMANGFITEDEALSLFTAHNTPLHQIDSITEQLLAMGVIITPDEDVAEQYIDRSKSDYNVYFNEVIELDPELTPFIEYIRNVTPPQTREWQNLIPQAQNGNEYAKNRLIEMYMRVAVRQALYFSKKYHLPIEDTLQDGLVGLISSIEKFNPADHIKFSTYLPWWITQSICRNRSLQCSQLYFPVHIEEKLFNVMEDVEEHFCDYCPENEQYPCVKLIELISKKNGWTVEETKKNIKYFSNCTSLDQMIENEEEISDDGLFNDELNDSLTKANHRKVLMELLNTIKPREREVLLYRNGFTEKGVLTLEEVGQIYGLTRERIRQLEGKALRRLQHSSRINRLKD